MVADMNETDDAEVFRLLRSCEASEVREAFKRRGEKILLEVRNAALEDAAMLVDERERRCHEGGASEHLASAAIAIRAMKDKQP